MNCFLESLGTLNVPERNQLLKSKKTSKPLFRMFNLRLLLTSGRIQISGTEWDMWNRSKLEHSAFCVFWVRRWINLKWYLKVSMSRLFYGILDVMGGLVASMVLTIYFAGFFSELYLWHINIQCTLVSQVRCISQGIQEIKHCNILLCWRQLVSVADGMIWGICLRKVYGLWIFKICVIRKSPLYQKGDLCVATTFHPLAQTGWCS